MIQLCSSNFVEHVCLGTVGLELLDFFQGRLGAGRMHFHSFWEPVYADGEAVQGQVPAWNDRSHFELRQQQVW